MQIRNPLKYCFPFAIRRKLQYGYRVHLGSCRRRWPSSAPVTSCPTIRSAPPLRKAHRARPCTCIAASDATPSADAACAPSSASWTRRSPPARRTARAPSTRPRSKVQPPTFADPPSSRRCGAISLAASESYDALVALQASGRGSVTTRVEAPEVVGLARLNAAASSSPSAIFCSPFRCRCRARRARRPRGKSRPYAPACRSWSRGRTAARRCATWDQPWSWRNRPRSSDCRSPWPARRSSSGCGRARR